MAQATGDQNELLARLERSMGMVWDVRERRQCIGGTCVHGRGIEGPPSHW